MFTERVGKAKNAAVMLLMSSVSATISRGPPISSSWRRGTARILRTSSRRMSAIACCENRISQTCEMKPVKILPSASAAKLATSAAVVPSGSLMARLTSAIRPALQAPLNSAMSPVTTTRPRHFFRRNLSRFIESRVQTLFSFSIALR